MVGRAAEGAEYRDKGLEVEERATKMKSERGGEAGTEAAAAKSSKNFWTSLKRVKLAGGSDPLCPLPLCPSHAHTSRPFMGSPAGTGLAAVVAAQI